jgi:large subunit ribosomal protein L35
VNLYNAPSQSGTKSGAAGMFFQHETWILSMPKQKSHKASRKRFRVTANGKLKRSQAGKKHLNSHKTGKRKRHLRAKLIETGVVAAKYVAHVGNI